MEPQTPDTSPDPAAGTPTAGATEPTANTEPISGEVQAEPAEDPAGVEAGRADEDKEYAELTARIAELEAANRGRTEDLQRLQAEYVNYKRRVDRDRDVAKNAGIELVVTDLMGVLDNLRIAQEHEEMSTGLKLLIDELDRIAGKHGLEGYGEKGEHFDPTVHEALMQAPMPGVSEPTVLDVMQVGYRFKGRVLRPARVAVGMPTDEPAPTPDPDPTPQGRP